MKTFYQNLNDTSALYNQSNSKFYSYIFKVSTLDDIKIKFNYIKKNFSDSSHICYAYRLYNGMTLLDEINISDFNTDACEPRGTAGLPTLNVLKKNNLINSCIFTVRYFGGKKLGIPGLIKAYTNSAQLVIKNNNLRLWFPQDEIHIKYSYKIERILNKIFKKYEVAILNQMFNDEIFSIINLKSTKLNQFINEIKTHTDAAYKIINK
tara:strand:+ start:2788 stop:3411 length:624 start_codon:yes stop_codon:yes gene_type:complete